MRLIESRFTMIVTYVVLAIGAFIALLPIALLLLNSIKPALQITVSPLAWPAPFAPENFVHAWNDAHFSRTFINSALVTAITIVLVCATASLSAYVLARRKIRSWQVWTFYLMATTTAPIQLFLFPLYFVYARLGLINNVPAVSIIYTALYSPFAVMLLRTYFLAVPRELEEAALVDGVEQTAGGGEAPGGGVDEERVVGAHMRQPVPGRHLVADQRVARRRIGDPQQRFGEAHQRHALLARQRIFVDQPLDALRPRFSAQRFDETAGRRGNAGSRRGRQGRGGAGHHRGCRGMGAAADLALGEVDRHRADRGVGDLGHREGERRGDHGPESQADSVHGASCFPQMLLLTDGSASSSRAEPTSRTTRKPSIRSSVPRQSRTSWKGSTPGRQLASSV